MVTLFKNGQRLWLNLAGRRILARVSRHTSDTVVTSPGPETPLMPGMVILVECPLSKGRALYWMQVSHAPNALGRDATLRRNPNAGGNFNRRGWRVASDLPVSLRRAGAPHFIVSTLTNLSMEGACVVSAAAMNENDGIELEFTLPDGPVCRIAGRISRLDQLSDPKAIYEPALFKAGIVFTGMTKATRRAITCFLWKRIRELHASSIRQPRVTNKTKP